MKIFTRTLSFLFILFSLNAYSQKGDSLATFTISGYVDAFAAYYTDSVSIDNYQKFPTVSPRSQQIGLNIAQLSAKYASEKLRGTIAMHYGDIPRSAWSANFNYIQEANVGIKLCKKLWFDGGFFRTHIGTEGLLPKENITSSLAVATYFEPYYEAGFKLEYVASDKLDINLFVLNGYNLYEDNNKKKSVGLLITYQLNDKLKIGYNNYFGDDAPQGDSVIRNHFYNNVFINYEKNKIKIIAGIDFCNQKNADLQESNKSASMVSGLASLRYAVTKQFGCYVRAEFYNDAQGFLSGSFADSDGKLTGLKLWGATAGLEYLPFANAYIRLEGRSLMADKHQEVFRWDHENKNTRIEVMLNLGVSFP